MTHEPEQTGPSAHTWWTDPGQRSRFERRMSGTGVSRRAVLGIIGAFTAGTALAACGSDKKDETAQSTAAPAGGSPAAGAQTGAAGEKLAKTQALKHSVTVEPSTFDYNFNLYAMSTSYPLAGLLKFDPEFNVQPDIAESFKVNDKGDVYTFKIRQGSKWSNGDPVTAKDFEFSWKRRLDPTTGADYAAFLYDIKNGEAVNNKKAGVTVSDLGVKAIDDGTLEVTLEGSAGYFPALVAYQAAFPAHPPSVAKWADKNGTDADKFVGNGPFKLTKWEHNKSFEIVKNEGYWNAKNVKLEKVTYLIVPQQNRLTAYENNEIDIVASGNVGDFKRVQGDSKLSKEMYRFDQVGTWYLMPNPRFKPFDLKEVRLAMAHAIDRDRLVKDVTQGLSSPSYTMNPPGTPFHNTNKYEQYTKYDPKLAMDALKGTPYEGGKNWPKITISMRNNEADAHQAAMAAIVQMFKENLGMTLESEVGDPQVVYKEMRQGNKQLMWIRWYMDFPDAKNTSYECFYSKIPAGSRRSWWENAEYDTAVAQGSVEPNQEKRKALYAAADETMIKDGGAIFAYYPLAYGLRKATLKGTPVNKAGQQVPDWNIFIRELETMYITEA